MINYSELPAMSAQTADPMQLNTLTLERNSVLVARVSRNSGYDLNELQTLKEYLVKTFPLHTVFVWWDDIEFSAITDKAYKESMTEVANYEPSSYYN